MGVPRLFVAACFVLTESTIHLFRRAVELFLENKQTMQGKPEFAWARLRLRQADSWLEFGTEDACAAGAQEATQKNVQGSPASSGWKPGKPLESRLKDVGRRCRSSVVGLSVRKNYKMEDGKWFLMPKILLRW
jgi:hypothetical protein